MREHLFHPPVQVTRGAALLGMGVLAAVQLFRTGVGLVSVAIVSRMLGPDDFGLVAAAAPFLGLAAFVQDLGLGQAMIQGRDIDAGRASAMFWTTVGLGIVSGMLLSAIAYPVSLFYGQAALAPILIASSLSPVLAAVQSMHMALLTRRGRFGRIACVEAASAVAGLVSAVALSWWLRSYWALVGSGLIASATALVGAWLACPWVPGLASFDSGYRDALRFGSGVSVSNVLTFVTRNADKVVIGRMVGMVPLGLYDRGYKLLMMPIQQVNGPVSRVTIPALSAARGDPARYRSVFDESVTGIMLLTQPAIVVATIGASSLVHVMLGPQWAGVVPIFAWLGCCSLHQVFTGTIGWLLLTQGRTRDLIRVSAFGSVTSIVAFVGGAHWGALGVAASYAISDYLVRLPVFWWLTGRSGPVSLGCLCRVSAPHFAASLVGAALMWATGLARDGGGSSGLLLAGCLVQAAYMVVLSAFPAKREIMRRNVGWATRGARAILVRWESSAAPVASTREAA